MTDDYSDMFQDVTPYQGSGDISGASSLQDSDFAQTGSLDTTLGDGSGTANSLNNLWARLTGGSPNAAGTPGKTDWSAVGKQGLSQLQGSQAGAAAQPFRAPTSLANRPSGGAASMQQLMQLMQQRRAQMAQLGIGQAESAGSAGLSGGGLLG